MTDALFPNESPKESPPAARLARAKARPRVKRPNRAQVELRPVDLESLLPDDHRTRVVWAFVTARNEQLQPLYDRILSVENHAGRPAIDPMLLVALWLHATLEAIGSARALARLCKEHDAYRWICGGVSVNHHTLADFRVEHVGVLDDILTASAATLIHEGLVDMKRVSQDGIRIRASAGAASFRRRETLEECLKQAEEQIEILLRELDDDPSATSRRQAAARNRAAEEKVRRLRAALETMTEVEKKLAEKKKKDAVQATAKKTEEERQQKLFAEQESTKSAKDKDKKKLKEPRVSSTDAEARVMKMADGGFRPAYNGQFAVDTKTQIIVGVDISNEGYDQDKMPPMLDQLEERYGETPEEMLVDGGFASHDAIDSAAAKDCTVYAPVRKSKNGGDPHIPRKTDSKPVAEWRKRMATEEAKETYKERAATVECVNAIARIRGLLQFPVRGKPKVKANLLWYAIAHNLHRALSLNAQLRPEFAVSA